MNRAQRALMRASGGQQIVDTLTKKNEEVHVALEMVESNYSRLERYLEDIDYINIFEPFNRSDTDIIPSAKRTQTINRLRRLRHENPVAKQAVRLAVRFTFGRGISYIIKNKRQKRIIDLFWNDPINQLTLTSHESMKQRFDETLTDGELFFLMAMDTVAPYVRLSIIPMEEIVDIIYDPENRVIPLLYKRRFREKVYDATANGGEGGWVDANPSGAPTVKYYRDYRITQEELDEVQGLNVPEEKIGEGVIKHRMINAVRQRSGMRGVSELFASREWFRVFKEFMEDRGAINAAANAFSYTRTVKGGPAALAKISGKIGTLDPTEEDASGSALNLRRLTRPVAGATYDSTDNIDFKPIRADTGAVHAKEDARLILMSAGAGVGTSIHYFGEGGDANLATAQAMELPMVKGYEDWQKFTEQEFWELCQFVWKTAINDPEADPFELAFDYPPIITQDVVKWTTAYAQLTQQIAPKNRKVREIAIRGGLYTLDVPNVDLVMPEIMVEEDRIAAEEQALKEQLNQNPGGETTAPSPNQKTATGSSNGNGNGKGGPVGGQKASNGGSVDPLGPDLKRIADGKPPRIPATGPRGGVPK